MRFTKRQFAIVGKSVSKKLADKNATDANIALIQSGPHCCVYDTDKLNLFVSLLKMKVFGYQHKVLIGLLKKV